LSGEYGSKEAIELLGLPYLAPADLKGSDNDINQGDARINS